MSRSSGAGHTAFCPRRDAENRKSAWGSLCVNGLLFAYMLQFTGENSDQTDVNEPWCKGAQSGSERLYWEIWALDVQTPERPVCRLHALLGAFVRVGVDGQQDYCFPRPAKGAHAGAPSGGHGHFRQYDLMCIYYYVNRCRGCMIDTGWL